MAKRAKASKSQRPADASKVRIIGGSLRGRFMPVADRPGLRPTGNRQREMLFNWLAMELPGARCLDCFAGTGALAMEAVSRDAAGVVCLEKDPGLAQAIRQQAEAFGVADRLQVETTDALSWLGRCPQPFDLAFVDPPFAADLWQPTLEALAGGPIRTGGLVYLEYPAPEPRFSIAPVWQVERSKRCAGVVCNLLRLATPESSS
jgi:16S rRNA (guanine966-N2)-methyltransferase